MTLAGEAATVGSGNEQDTSAGSAPVNALASVAAWSSQRWYAVGWALFCTACAAAVSCIACQPLTLTSASKNLAGRVARVA